MYFYIEAYTRGERLGSEGFLVRGISPDACRGFPLALNKGVRLNIEGFFILLFETK